MLYRQVTCAERYMLGLLRQRGLAPAAIARLLQRHRRTISRDLRRNRAHSDGGFEFRSSGGFLFRGTAYALISGGGYVIWPGLTVGYAFEHVAPRHPARHAGRTSG